MPQQTALERLRAKRTTRQATSTPKRSWGDTYRDYRTAGGEGVRDMAEGISEMFKASRGDTMAASRVGEGLLQSVEDIKKKPSETGMILGEQLTGIPFRQTADELGRGEYAKAAGHATVPIAMLGLGARAGMKGAKPKPKPAPIVEPRAPLQLPERAGPGGSPRFFQGEAGVADATQSYKRHTGNPNPYIESGTQTLSDVGEIVTLPPELAAQGYGPQKAPPVSIGKQRTRAAQAAFMAREAEKARQPKMGAQIGGRERLNMDVETIGGEGFPETGLARQTPGTPSIEKLTAQQPRQGYYPAEDPNVKGIGNVEPVGQQGSTRAELPSGHKDALRKMGVPEDKIHSMSVAQADRILKATTKADPKIPMARTGPKKNAYGDVPDPNAGNLRVAMEQVKADLKADIASGEPTKRPYRSLSDNDLMTLGTHGDAIAIKEMVGRKRGEFQRGMSSAPVPGRPGDVAPFAEPRPSIADRLGDERGMVDLTGKKGIPPSRGEPGSPERFRYIAWEHGEAWRSKQAKLDAIKSKSPAEINWDKDWEADTRVRSLEEAQREIDYFRDREQKSLEAIGQKSTPNPGDVAPVTPTAKYAFEQAEWGGKSTSMYNVEGGARHGSTVSAETLKEMGIPIPEKTAPMAKPLTLEERQAAASSPKLETWEFGRNKENIGLGMRGPGGLTHVGQVTKTVEGMFKAHSQDRTYGTFATAQEAVQAIKDANVPKRKGFMDETGSVLLEGKPRKTIDFDKPLPASEKGNIFHRTVNKVFDTNFANWVNARNASKVEGVIKRREFADLDAAGFDGITAFQEGIVTGGRFADIKKYFDAKHQELSAVGVKLGFRENYLPQLWENPADEVFAVSKRLGLKPTFTLERVLENYKAGIEQGLKPKYKNIGELMGWYEGRANKAIADRQFFDHLRESKQILPEGKAPSEWATINPDHFPVQKFKTARGEHVTKNYKAPPDIAKAINNYLGEGHEAFKWVGDKAAITKNIVLSSGVPGTAINAHGFNISARNVMANGVVKGGIQAAKYLINTGADSWIGRGIEKISPWESARKFFDDNLRDAADAAHHGLTVMVEDHVMGGKGTVHLLREAKTGPGKLANKGFNKFLSWQGKYFEDPLFQHVVPALKVKHWRGMADDMVKQGVKEVDAKKAAAAATNEIYGGINWEAMQRSRDIQNLMRGIVLAPDWFETQYRIGKGMANTLRDPKNPRGLAYKRVAANLVAAYVAADVINYTVNKQHMWENETGHALDIKMGSTGGKTRWVRPFGTSADFLRLPFDTIVGVAQGDLSAPGKILKNRMSTVARPTANLFMNQDAFGNPIFGPDKYGHPQTRTEQLGAAGREVASAVTPQYVKAPLGYATGRAGSKEEAILGGLEAPVRYSRESTKRTSRYRPTRKPPTRQPPAR